MKRLVLITLASVLIATGLVWRTPAGGRAQAQAPDTTGDIIVKNATMCHTNYPTLQCNGARCGNGKIVWWNVVNEHDQDAIVVLVNFQHRASEMYIDPLVGPANNREHYVDVDARTGNVNGEATLRTIVRKIYHKYFTGPYDYKVALSTDGGTSFSICLDPMIDIDN